MSATLFLDESKLGRFTFGAVCAPQQQIAVIRASLREARARGTSRIHFVRDSDSVKRDVISILKRFRLRCWSISVVGQPEVLARRAVLQTLVTEYRGFSGIVIERDDTMVARDRRAIEDAMRARSTLLELEYSHMAATDEPLLWAADAIAWCANRTDGWLRFAQDELRMTSRVI